jgi:hypothetical protein
LAHQRLNTPCLLSIMGRICQIFINLCSHKWSGKYEAHLWDNSCRLQ